MKRGVNSMRLCVIPGDGIGQEVLPEALRVLQALAPDIELSQAQMGWAVFQETGTALPDSALEAASNADAVLFGAVASPSHPVPGYRSPIVALRRALQLYANIRPTTLESGASLVVVRENTEDLYIGRERLEDDGATAIAERVITRSASERITRAAYELARRRKAAGEGPGKVTIVHKANVLRVSDGLFRETALAVAREYEDLLTEELLVDTAAMHLARTPERFDVIVTTNMFGDILSDISAVHGGGLGLASSANYGETKALFEPVHGAAPDIVGKQIANPLAAIGCIGMFLEWAGRAEAAQRLQQAAAAVLHEGPHTPDLGGAAHTADVTAAVLARLG